MSVKYQREKKYHELLLSILIKHSNVFLGMVRVWCKFRFISANLMTHLKKITALREIIIIITFRSSKLKPPSRKKLWESVLLTLGDIIKLSSTTMKCVPAKYHLVIYTLQIIFTHKFEPCVQSQISRLNNHIYHQSSITLFV